MSELPPTGEEDNLDDLYRRASAADASQPSEPVRRAVLEHAARLAAARSVPRRRYRRGATYGLLAAACLAGLLVVPRFLSNPHGPASGELRHSTALNEPRLDSGARDAPSADVSTTTERAAMARSSPAAPPAPASRAAAAASPETQAAVTADAGSLPMNQALAKAQSAYKSPATARAPVASAQSVPSDARGMAESQGSMAADRAERADSRAARASVEPAQDIDARDGNGRTALMLAVLGNQIASVNALLARGADPNAVDAGGVSPLQAAIGAHENAIADALRRAGAR